MRVVEGCLWEDHILRLGFSEWEVPSSASETVGREGQEGH